MEIEKPNFMTQEQAEKRYSMIKQGSINYNLHLALEKGTTFRGLVEASFETLNLTEDLFIDFRGNDLFKIVINGNEISQDKPNFAHVFDGLFIKLPLNHLKSNEKNTVTIVYQNKYADDGLGLHSFTDTDGKQYIYSQCESFWCNRIFPNFDQPNLKATMKLTAVYPNDWIMLSNQFAEQQGAFNKESFTSAGSNADILLQGMSLENKNISYFKTTQILPTYLFGFAAGPYVVIKGPNSYNNIPMNVYCRESSLPYLQKYSDFIFEITNECMRFFVEFFGYPYPFEKYDQIFCPEFNCGAMENAGLVTFNDTRFVFKEEISDTRMTVFLNVIAHELCHHWFGNLVTMKWWNDLWLNESFADFMGHFVLTKISSKIRRIADGFVLFNNRKVWGYNTDQQITTHPIAGDVPNTEVAENIFDGITYAKGASTLRQLLSLIGEQNFSSAMKRYFNKFAFKNADLNDFIENLDVEFQTLNLGFSLKEWQQEWISTAGLNECQPEFDPNNQNSHACLCIHQTCALEMHPTLRRHNMKVAFFDENCNITEQTVILKPAEKTTIEYDGSKNFKAVLLNYGDYAFIKTILDPVSLTFLQHNLHKISDVLTRTLIWKAFYDMARDGKISSEQYVDIFISCIKNEVSEEIVAPQFTYLSNIVSLFTPLKYKSILKQKLFSFCYNFLLSTSKEQKNKIITIKTALIQYADSQEQISSLVQWFKGQNKELEGFEIGNEGEWQIVCLAHQSSQYTLQEKKQIFDEQLKKDSSDTSKNMEQKCRAIVASAEERQVLWNQYINKLEFSQRILQNSMEGFVSTKDSDLIKPYNEKFFADIKVVYANQIPEYASIVYDSLQPQSDDLDWLIAQYTNVLSSVPSTQVFFTRRLKETLDLLQRKKRAFTCFYQRTQLQV
ncbi:peptidase M1 family aminopeptidase (macronuclear) [Tetrahymena thermophila SB210]|uniref:Peptidase M1 family aminopeptidase n=1 Tax=Tetrahymena thermophila (strain SB210) TaxID=312017 RepID=I7MHC3_TETTS|nr:peptidase M1 family aminopeptidase [Tetrahymena thermophila SB210]EAS02835.3 peptidase M1 family aminopeptidase [Tetrahymena thermophila SB210]|eukprot:XP_001023080.3 peptidase M1 family aminopeptidase [Tetrahymena thermophila SB210]